jgi:FAD-dependent fumarate reductase
MKIGQILIFIISILIAFSYYFIIKNYPELMPSYIQNLQKYFFSNPETTKQPEYDIIIVGAGLAGLTSAYEANLISNGKLKILLLEQEKKYGGNSIKASSGINILNSPIQEKEKIKDSYNLFYNDTIRSGKGRSIPQLVSTLVNDSHDIFNYYTKLGIDLSHVGLLGGHSAARTHRPEKIAVGYHLDSSMFNVIKDIKNIKYQVNSTVIELIYNKDKRELNGIVYYNSYNKKNVKIYSKWVILTCNGFSHDFESDSLLKEFVPHIMIFTTTNCPQINGIGIKIARTIGVQLVDMDQVQIYSTAFLN